MWRTLLALLVLVGVQGALTAQVQRKLTPKAEAVKADPNDPVAINAYVMEVVIDALNGKQPVENLDELSEFLDQLPTDAPVGKAAIRSGKQRAIHYRNMLLAGRTTLTDLEKKITNNPDDVRTIGIYAMKIQTDVHRLTSKQPDEASLQLARAQTILKRVGESSQNEQAKEQLKLADDKLVELKRYIAFNRRLTEVLGQDAPSTQADAWLNGSPLSDADLKGKVVLLDFFAVWCGPCIKTFPDLRQWHEQFAEKGLVIIGVSRYYNYRWDEEKQLAIAVDKEVEQIPSVEENKTMEGFAKQHKLPYHIAMTQDRGLHDFYGGNYIPHVVLIDRHGKVRLNRSGDVAESTKEIAGLIEKLLSEAVAAVNE